MNFVLQLVKRLHNTQASSFLSVFFYSTQSTLPEDREKHFQTQAIQYCLYTPALHSHLYAPVPRDVPTPRTSPYLLVNFNCFTGLSHRQIA
jgi:hypothetical protein